MRDLLYFFDDSVCGQQARSVEWSKTSLGSAEHWPVGLKSLLALLFRNKNPMCLMWGADLICFYNDAYRANFNSENSLKSLGQKATTCFSETWSLVQHFVHQALIGNPAKQMDHVVPFEECVVDSEIYWSSNYLPAFDEQGLIAGVIITCTETTARVLELKKLQQKNAEISEAQSTLEMIFKQSPGFLAIFKGKDHVFEKVNSKYMELIGSRDVVGKPIREALPEIAGQGYFEILDHVFATGEAYTGVEAEVKLQRFQETPMETTYLDFVYLPIQGADGNALGIYVHGYDVTEKVLARKKIEVEQSKLAAIFNESPAAMALLKGPDLIYEKVNPQYTETIGGRNPLGQRWVDGLSELASSHFPGILKKVFETGETYSFHEMPATLMRHAGQAPEQRFFDGAYSRILDEQGNPYGIFTYSVDVTERVNASKRVEESQAQLNLALESAKMGMWHINLKTHTVTVSSQISKILGIEDVKDEDIFEINKRMIHSEDLAMTNAAWEQAVHHKTPYAHEYRIVRQDGSERWLFSAGKAILDPQGNPLSLAGITMDVTERKLAESRSRESDARIRTFADAMPEMAFIANADGKFVYCNERMYRFNNNAETIATDQNCSGVVIHPEDTVRATELWNLSLQTGRPFQVEYRLQRHDGEYRWHLARAVKALDEWYGTITDIHMQKMHEEQLRRAMEDAEKANHSKSAFLANMSHEIRTPLGAILGFTDLMRDTNSVEEKHEMAKIISRNGKSLTKIIDDILDLSKVEAGRLELERIDFNLLQFIEEISDLFQDRIKTGKLRFDITFDSEVPTTVHTDPTRLRQILINLIGNAVKFTAAGRIALHIEPVMQAQKMSKLKFTLSDTGIGLDVDQASRLFETFTQADNSTTRRYGGSGLGLALSRRLARALGGDVILEKFAQNEGCTFVVTVDAKVAAVPAVTQRLDAMSALKEASRNLKKPKVLLVEDSVDNQLLVQLVLQKAGIPIDLANNGAEGVEQARRKSYDVILMDMQMPVLDGYAATEQLRSGGYRKPIVALTAHAMAEEGRRIAQVGCNAHLTKPLDAQLLIRTIQDLS